MAGAGSEEEKERGGEGRERASHVYCDLTRIFLGQT